MCIILGATPFYSKGQIKYTGRIEYSSMQYVSSIIRYESDYGDPYYLDEKINGKELNFVNGILIKKRGLLGMGISYLNLGEIKGFSTTLDAEYIPSKRKLSPLLNFRFGRSYLKNQYEVSKSATLAGADIGVNYKPFKILQFYLKAGFVITHNVGFYTWRGGIRL